MRTYLLTIASPDGNIFAGEVANLILRGAEGDLAVMAGHAPFITSVQPCVCRVILPDGSEKSGQIHGGLLTVAADSVTLMTTDLQLS